MTPLLVFVIGACTLWCLVSWRAGVVLAIVVGVLQDPIRKMLPDAPWWLAGASIPVWLALCVSGTRRSSRLKALRRQEPALVRAASWFLLTLPLAAAAMLRGGSQRWIIALAGIVAYLVPLLLVLAGYAFAQREADVRRFLTLYSAFTAIMLVGTLLEHLHLAPRWNALGTEALGATWIRSTDHGPVKLSAGFFRSPELMSWHAAMLAMIALTLALASGRLRLWPWAPVAAWALICLMLGGRRKMIFMPLLWGATLAAGLVGIGRARGVVAVGVAALLAITGLFVAGQEFEVTLEHYQLAGSGAGDAPDRVIQILVSVVNSVRVAGFFGAGIGTNLPGSQHYGRSSVSSDVETGPAKLIVELGVPGLLAALYLALRGGLSISRLVRSPGRPDVWFLRVGLGGILIANAGSFFVSHQAFGDPTVLGVSALLVGVVLGSARWEPKHAARTGPAFLA